MKKILVALALLGLAAPGWSQSNQKATTLLYNYDLTGTSYTYCKFLGKGGDPWGLAGGNPSPASVKTAGSSTTVSALTTGTNPYAQVGVGDLLTFQYLGTSYTRLVTARADADNVTVDTAIDLGTAGVPFQFYKMSCGTTATDGWLDVSLFYNLTFGRNIATINATSIDTQVECRLNDVPGATFIIDTKNATAVGAYAVTITAGAWDSCRMGMKINTDTGVQSIYAGVSYNR